MRIAVNTRLLLPGKLEGLGWFSYETLKRITQSHPEHQFIFIFDRKYSDEFIFSDNITPVVAYPPSRHPVLWYLYFDWALPRVLLKYKADIFLSPDGWLSLRTNVPSLPVIHDLNFFHNPQWISPATRAYFNYFFPRFARKAIRIGTVSEFSKNDISTRFQISPEKIDVLFNGSNESYHPVDDEIKTRIWQKYTREKPYFLFLGLIHPRKNLDNIMLAYNKFREQTEEDIKLLVVGSAKYQTEESRQIYEKSTYKQDIIFAGRIPDSDLNNVIASSYALVYTSLFEGFGIPILEAMRCGVPVITSNISSMPEVAGDAAILTDPYSVDSISEALISLAKDEKLRISLIAKGHIQKIKFSWDRTAELLWQSIEKLGVS
jgi:glycosyltransferase involved in cell wall biosynthesis